MGAVGVTVPTHGLRVWLNSQKHRGSLGELCVRDLSNEPQKMTSLPGNRNQQNPEPRYPGLHSGEEPPSHITCYQDVLLSAPAQRPGPQEGSQAECVDHCQRWLRAPRGGLWPFARRNRKVMWEPQAGPGPLSHPTCVTLSPFPMSVEGGFSGCAGLQQAQVDVGSEPVGRCYPHPRGE